MGTVSSLQPKENKKGGGNRIIRSNFFVYN
jgi:hypothetical protein